jgi:hypothetical protein
LPNFIVQKLDKIADKKSVSMNDILKDVIVGWLDSQPDEG